MQEKDLENVFGAENVQRFSDGNSLLEKCDSIEKELGELTNEMKLAFKIDLSLADILVAGVGGIINGAVSGLFKTNVPKHGKFKHKHSTTRTAVDYQVPKPEGFKENVQGLHRQIGPGHDLLRFKEALDLISGKKKDFPLWGSTLSQHTGGVMRPGNMKIENFLAKGFKIPDDPKRELVNHLVIDFFTKTSLPIPGTTYLADNSEVLAKIMMILYKNGLNLKTAAGNTGSTFLLSLIINGYIFLLKTAPKTELLKRVSSGDTTCIKDCIKHQKDYEKSNEYHVMNTIAFGSLFMVDTIITTSSKNYLGLLELNYPSLLIFLKHLIQYLLSVKKERDTLKKKKLALIDSRRGLQKEFYQLIQEELSDVAKADGLLLSMEPSNLLSEQEMVSNKVSSISDLVQKRKELSNEGSEE